MQTLDDLEDLTEAMDYRDGRWERERERERETRNPVLSAWLDDITMIHSNQGQIGHYSEKSCYDMTMRLAKLIRMIGELEDEKNNMDER